MRIAIASISRESLNSLPISATADDFIRRRGLPDLAIRQERIRGLQERNTGCRSATRSDWSRNASRGAKETAL